MSVRSPDFDLLRPGVLLAEDIKLLERIPRWIACRRHLAEFRGARAQLLFFDEPEEEFSAWKSVLGKLQALDCDSLLPIFAVGELRNFQFVAARIYTEPPLRVLLDEEGPLAPRQAVELVQGIRKSLAAMQQAGLAFPAISPEAILITEKRERQCVPILFPFPLRAFPSPDEHEIPFRLRDLLYEASTNLTPPAAYQPRDLMALPPAIRRAWQPIFSDVPDLSILDDWVEEEEESLPVQSRGNPGARSSILPPVKPALPPRGQTAQEPGRTAPAISAKSAGKSTMASVVSTVAAVAAAAGVVWFSYTLVESLRNPPYSDKSALATVIAQAGDAATSPPTLPNGASDSIAADSPAPVSTASLPPSTDPPGKPGEHLNDWWMRWQADRQNTEITEAFSRYILALEPWADAMRSGTQPKLLQQLESVAKDGPPAATYLLGIVLWGRETHRAEQLMIRIARGGYKPAQDWCDEQLIDWK